MQFLRKLNAGEIEPPKAPVHPSPTPVRRSVSEAPPTQTPQPNISPEQNEMYGQERLRDYVGAFVLAGLDPQIGAELEFFADRVNYFGRPNVSRDKIRRDLLRYDRRWPERRFWLAGEVEVQHRSDGNVRVTFPLRYELRSRSDHASGKVHKTLLLRKSGDGGLEIVSVNEQKA
jgi:hypothetical protein